MANQDKVYIFRKFFGFDVLSMIYQMRNVVDADDAELLFYGTEYFRLTDNIAAWVDFYCKWICNLDTIQDVFLEFIENVHLNLKPIYDTASDTLKKQLDRAICKNPKEFVKEEFSLGIVREAFDLEY